MRRTTPSFGRKKNSKGMTFIETMVVIVIALVALVAAIAGGVKIFSKSDVANDLTGIGQLQTNTKSLKGKSGYGTAGTSLVAALIATDSVPSTMTVSGNTIVNAWGGAVNVVSTGLGFTISSAEVPKEACIEEASKLSRAFQSTKVGTSTAVTGEVSPAVATTSCSSDANTIAWTSLN